jgi:hypothetical protein
MASENNRAEGSAEVVDGRTPVADRIRERIQKAGARFHANDNISEYIEAGEIEALQREIELKMAEVLRALVIDTESDHNTIDTARRVAKMYLREVFGGRYRPQPPAFLRWGAGGGAIRCCRAASGAGRARSAASKAAG